MDTKRKVDESLALLNSLFAHPNKKSFAGKLASDTNDGTSYSEGISGKDGEADASHVHDQPSSTVTVTAGLKKRIYLPPRPSVLDKLSRLSTSRPTLEDSIAASIAASASATQSGYSEAPVHHLSSKYMPTAVPSSKKPVVGSLKSNKQRYLPWSRDQFHERLKTFKPSTWFDKPKAVNAVECAKRGWINQGDDRLECCGGCNGVVIVKTDYEQSRGDGDMTVDNVEGTSNDDSEMFDLLQETDLEVLGSKFHAMLTDNHESTCPWKTHPCDNNIYKFPVVTPSQAREDLLYRLHQLEAMASDPLIEKIRHPLGNAEVEELKGMFPDIENNKLLILSLFGWTAQRDRKMLICSACHTQCTYIPSIPNFGSSSDDLTSEVDKHTDSNLNEGEENDAAFDVVQSHRWYCYWVDPQYDTEMREGWRILLAGLTTSSARGKSTVDGSLDHHSTTKIAPNEALIQVRRMLRGQTALSSVRRSEI